MADEVFFVGNAAEVTPIAAIDEFVVGNGEAGPVTARLQRLLHDVARGAAPGYAEWRTPVGLRQVATAAAD
ncbi:Branched-chain-amino-acid aminotransferase [compost metagenome]